MCCVHAHKEMCLQVTVYVCEHVFMCELSVRVYVCVTYMHVYVSGIREYVHVCICGVYVVCIYVSCIFLCEYVCLCLYASNRNILNPEILPYSIKSYRFYGP